MKLKTNDRVQTLGGQGSGNFGHAGIPGQVGGSAGDGGGNGENDPRGSNPVIVSDTGVVSIFDQKGLPPVVLFTGKSKIVTSGESFTKTLNKYNSLRDSLKGANFKQKSGKMEPFSTGPNDMKQTDTFTRDNVTVEATLLARDGASTGALQMKVIKNNEEESSMNGIRHLMSKLVKKDTLDDRDMLVVPTVLICEGVHNGAFYSADEIQKFPESWNGRPVVVRHPNKDGVPVTAGQTTVLEGQTVGAIYNCEWDGATNKLKGEAWIDVAKCMAVAPEVLEKLEKNERLEVSTGLFTEDEELQINSKWGNEDYGTVVKNFRPDHLAILPDSVGACSWEDGAGMPRLNEQHENEGTSEGAVKGWETRKGGSIGSEADLLKMSAGDLKSEYEETKSKLDKVESRLEASKDNSPLEKKLSNEKSTLESRLGKLDTAMELKKGTPKEDLLVPEAWAKWGLKKNENCSKYSKAQMEKMVKDRERNNEEQLKDLGGQGLGNFGHSGRPGERGGSGGGGMPRLNEQHSNEGTSEGAVKGWETRRGGGHNDKPEDEKYNTGAQKARDENIIVGDKVVIGTAQGGGIGVVVGFDRDGSFATVRTGGKYKSFHNSDLALKDISEETKRSQETTETEKTSWMDVKEPAPSFAAEDRRRRDRERNNEEQLKDLGGQGLGNFGHSGRPGERGGSGGGGGSEKESFEKKRDAISKVYADIGDYSVLDSAGKLEYSVRVPKARADADAVGKKIGSVGDYSATEEEHGKIIVYKTIIHQPKNNKAKTTSNTIHTKPLKGVHMDREEQIATLIKGGKWNEGAREFLTNLEDETFQHIVALSQDATEAEAPKPAKPVTLEEYVAGAPVEVRSVLTRAIVRDQAVKSGIVNSLKANSRCKFNEAELNSMDISSLEKMAALAQVEVDYAGVAGAAPKTNEADIELEAPAMPALFGKK